MPRATRRNIRSGYIKTGSRTTRIKMFQNPDRPFRIRRRLIAKTTLQKNPWWWITHRRGILRRRVGVDPLEMRAVPKTEVKGTLPERIVLKWLIRAHFINGIDFDFQSSVDGGRLELGGLVVDFLFPLMKMVIQVDGPTHTSLRRERKDEEQRSTLEMMGYRVYNLEMNLIYNEPRFEAEMRKIFNFGFPLWDGGVFGNYEAPEDSELHLVNDLILQAERVFRMFSDANQKLLGVRIDL